MISESLRVIWGNNVKKTCFICKSDEWLPLPDPVSFQSVATSSRIVPQPLGKSVCMTCGLVQRVRATFLGLSSYYEEDYANYYERPGTEAFHFKRYQQLVGWMKDHVNENFAFSTVLDVGCGQGWAMDAMSASFPNIDIYGIEPSKFNATIARKKGHKVYLGKIEDLEIDKKFDLIYSNNVLQHVNDPVAFLTSIKELTSENGVIIITCPDGSRPNIELLFSDHNYSFLPGNLIKMSGAAFEKVIWDASKEDPSLPPAQLILLSNNSKYTKPELKISDFPQPEIEKSAIEKIEYLDMLKKLNDHLMTNIQGSGEVYNFGASFWTSVLAAYCTDYWNNVEACIVDNKDAAKEFMGKKIIALNDIKELENALIVLGTSPATHEFLSQKMNGINVIRWDAFFKY